MTIELRRFLKTGACLLAMVVLPARADIVSDWSMTAARTIAPMGVATAPTPEERVPNYAVDMATVHVAIYDTLNAFDGRYDPFGAVPTAEIAGASRDAAVSEAAYRVLAALFPSRAALYQADYDARLALVIDTAARERGRAVGADVAAQIVAWRASDGRETPATWTNGTLPGEFQTTGAPLVNITAPSIRPFTLTRASQFRPAGPPALDSEQYAEDYEEVQRLGVSDATSVRTTDQDDLAKFHTEAPPVFWPRNLVRFARASDVTDNARLLAAMWVAQADAAIGCFEAKYHYNFWRPRTAIPAAGTDGNEATAADIAWLPNEPTPNHPEYPAAHGCAAGAAMEVVRQLGGTKRLTFAIDSTVPGVLQTTRSYASTDAFLRDVKEARILGGMHFRTSVDDGTSLGRQAAKWVLRHYFRPAECRD